MYSGNSSLYKTLFEASDDAMLLFKGEKIVHCNPACIRILKATTKDDILATHPAEFSPAFQANGADSWKEASKMLETCLQNGFNRFDWLHRRFDGEVFPAEVTLTRIEENKEAYVFAVIRDISVWKNSETARKDAEEKLSLIAENTDDIIWIRDLRFRYTYLSPSVERVKGFTVEEALKIKPTEAVFREDMKLAYRYLREELENEKNPTIEKKRSRRFQMREYKKDGSLMWAEQSMSFLRDQNQKPIGIIGISRDITDQKRFVDELKEAKARAEESDRLKSSFLANMSHEIRTPLNAILGFSELLADDQLDAEDKSQFATIISKSSNHLLAIISDIFEISKLESNQIKLRLRPANIKSMIESFTNYGSTLDPEISKGRSLTIASIPDKFNTEYLIDESRIIQIITNLIDNAFKFSDHGEVRLEAKQTSKGFLKVQISDYGQGIPREEQQYIFDRFRQGHESLDRQFGGTGLGLSICKGLLELMGGEIGVDSEEGKGSTFSFVIPLIKN